MGKKKQVISCSSRSAELQGLGKMQTSASKVPPSKSSKLEEVVYAVADIDKIDRMTTFQVMEFFSRREI